MGRRRVATGHDASRCVMLRHDASWSGIVHASRRVTTRRDASRPVTTHLRLDVSRRVTTRHGASWSVTTCRRRSTMRHDASRRVAMRHRRDVSRRDKVSRHDASWSVTQCVTTPHDASRCGTVATCLDAKRCHHASRVCDFHRFSESPGRIRAVLGQTEPS